MPALRDRAGHALHGAARRLGLEVRRIGADSAPSLTEYDAEHREIMRQVLSETMTSPARLAALIDAVRHVDRHSIDGALVECGVWRGGSSMAAALAHLSSGPPRRDLYLYDTFEGMPPPTDVDVEAHSGRTAEQALVEDPDDGVVRARAGLETVRRNMAATAYDADRVHYVAGKVEDTIPATLPDRIAVLRLDTDWYESTRHELTHLVPLVSPGGLLIIDDYGHWQGARRAVDEWLSQQPRPVFLSRIDYTGRLAVLG